MCYLQKDFKIRFEFFIIEIHRGNCLVFTIEQIGISLFQQLKVPNLYGQGGHKGIITHFFTLELAPIIIYQHIELFVIVLMKNQLET